MRWEAFVSRYMLTYLALLCVMIPVLLNILMQEYNLKPIGYAVIGVIMFVGTSESVKMLEYHADAYQNSVQKTE